MASYLRFLAVLLVFVALAVQGKPLEDDKQVATGDEEMMEVAEAQNPFLPRFAMKKLKERREKARAERRNQGQRRFDQRPPRPYRPPCPYYVSIQYILGYRQ